VPNPYSVNLYENIQKLKLDVSQIAALHGQALSRSLTAHCNWTGSDAIAHPCGGADAASREQRPNGKE